MELSDPQKRVLRYLALCQHSTSNIMKRNWGRMPHLSLRILEAQGLVTHVVSATFLSSNVRWEITEQGFERAQALGLVP